ncbi:MAG: hypothetical protein KGY61_11580 [Desulfobacterales bacterium]|nr:hypothetical protein [Desulfobacterales bacterium]
MPIHKWLICPISVSGANFNPQHTRMPAVKIFAFLELEQIILFMDGHYPPMDHVKGEIIAFVKNPDSILNLPAIIFLRSQIPHHQHIASFRRLLLMLAGWEYLIIERFNFMKNKI